MLQAHQLCAGLLAAALLSAAPAGWAQEPGAAYPDDAWGLERQMQQVARAYYAGNPREFERRARQFALPRPEAWMGRVFGADRAEPLAEDYRRHFRSFQAELARALARSGSRDSGSLQAWPAEDLPNASRVAPRPDAPVPQEAVRVQRFQFRLGDEGAKSPRWMDSFVYEGGAFRFIGRGAFPFWDYPLVVGMGSSSASGR
jgi:hypothetical protein